MSQFFYDTLEHQMPTICLHSWEKNRGGKNHSQAGNLNKDDDNESLNDPFIFQ